MTSLAAWSPPQAGWCLDASGRPLPLTVEAQRWLTYLYLRVGGPTAPSNADIAVTEYADSGIEESKWITHQLRSDLEQAQTDNHSLRALVETMMQRVCEQSEADNNSLRAIVETLARRVSDLEQGQNL